MTYYALTIKIILTTMILLAFNACSFFQHKESISPAKSDIRTPSNNSVIDESNRLAQAKLANEDFLIFKKVWNTRILGSFQEPLLDKADNKIDETYRFFWVPSFDNPVAIRVWRKGKKQFLVVKKVDGEGFGMKKLSYEKLRDLTEEEWVKFMNMIDQTSFWMMPAIDIDLDPVNDGAFYVIEGRKNNQFHEVHRATGSNKIDEVRQLGEYLLSLTELKTKYSEY